MYMNVHESFINNITFSKHEMFGYNSIIFGQLNCIFIVFNNQIMSLSQTCEKSQTLLTDISWKIGDISCNQAA